MIELVCGDGCQSSEPTFGWVKSTDWLPTRKSVGKMSLGVSSVRHVYALMRWPVHLAASQSPQASYMLPTHFFGVGDLLDTSAECEFTDEMP